MDAKIASKIIATRIVKVLPEIIHANQLGYVKGRFIGEAARSILDVMDYTKKENIPGILLFIDFEKAFDSLNWNFLLKCLECLKCSLYLCLMLNLQNAFLNCLIFSRLVLV